MTDLPDHLKFGYEYVQFCHAERERLIASGMTDPMQLHFAVSEAYMKSQEGKPTYRERHAAWLAKQPKRAGMLLDLTDEELAYLREKLEGVNDPVGGLILDKLNGSTATV